MEKQKTFYSCPHKAEQNTGGDKNRISKTLVMPATLQDYRKGKATMAFDIN